MLTAGEKVPDATVIKMGDDGPEQASIVDMLAGRKVVVFGLPGAFTSTCSNAHVPSFIQTAKELLNNGVDEIICLSVNDAHVMRAWGDATAGTAAGITFLADADGSFTTAIDMKFDAPVAGLFGRSKRYSMLVEDGVVTFFNVEPKAGEFGLTGGEAMLAQVKG
ncbi:MAG: peroxiredoxin [Paracoccaceae bacterium]